MFHPDAFNGTTKEFQAYVILDGKYGLAAMICVLAVFVTFYIFPDAYNPKSVFSNFDVVIYVIDFLLFALSFFLIYKITKIKRPNAYDQK